MILKKWHQQFTIQKKNTESLNLHSIMSHVCLVLVHWSLGMASPYCSPIKQESKWDLSSPTRWRKARWWSEKHFFQLTLFDHVNGGHKIQPWKGHLKPTKKGNERKNRSTPFSTSIQFEHLEVMWLKLLEMWWIFVNFCIPNTQIFTSLTNFKKQNAIFFFLP